jgi:hypothetical protein
MDEIEAKKSSMAAGVILPDVRSEDDRLESGGVTGRRWLALFGLFLLVGGVVFFPTMIGLDL